MSKGMSMEEFRQALSSDAREENEKLKKELDELKESSSKEINELKEDLELHKKWTQALGNRCHMFTNGQLCMSCCIEACKYYIEAQQKLNLMVEYMDKYKLPRNEDSLYKAEKYANSKMKAKNIRENEDVSRC